MGEFSISHILLLAIIFLIFFGPSRLPALGQSLGKAIKGFKQGLTEIDADVKDVSTPPTAEQLNQAQQQNAAAQQAQKQNSNQNNS